MCILSTLSTLNGIENYYCHIEFRMDSMHIGTQTLAVFEMAYLLTAYCLLPSTQYTVHTAYYYLKNSV